MRMTIMKRAAGYSGMNGPAVGDGGYCQSEHELPAMVVRTMSYNRRSSPRIYTGKEDPQGYVCIEVRSL